MNEYSRIPLLLRSSGMLNEVYSYSQVTCDPVPRKLVELCTSNTCAAHFLSGVVTKSRNGNCVKCGHPTFSKLFFNSTLEGYERREVLARRNYEAERIFNDVISSEKSALRKRRNHLIKTLDDSSYFYLGRHEKLLYEKEVKEIGERLEVLSKTKYKKMEE